MQEEQELLFMFGGEGGGISITFDNNKEDHNYIYHHSESYYLDDEDDECLSVNKTDTYNSFEEAFQQINDRYPWYSMFFNVNKAYQTYVIQQIPLSARLEGATQKEIDEAIEKAKKRLEQSDEYKKYK